MRRLLIVPGLYFLFLIPLYAQRYDKQGKAWLDSCADPSALNVTGIWSSPAWGKISLSQRDNTRKIVGSGDGWDISGVVSGNSVCLLFSHHDKVVYSAKLTADGPARLTGSYTTGLLTDGRKSKAVQLVK
jgi:hypothetical protein